MPQTCDRVSEQQTMDIEDVQLVQDRSPLKKRAADDSGSGDEAGSRKRLNSAGSASRIATQIIQFEKDAEARINGWTVLDEDAFTDIEDICRQVESKGPGTGFEPFKAKIRVLMKTLRRICDLHNIHEASNKQTAQIKHIVDEIRCEQKKQSHVLQELLGSKPKTLQVGDRRTSGTDIQTTQQNSTQLKSYAMAAAEGAKNVLQTSMPIPTALVVRPNDITQLSQSTKQLIIESVKRDDKVGPMRFRHISKGGVVIFTRSAEERAALEKLIHNKLKEKMNMKNLYPRRPTIIIKRVRASVSKEELWSKLIEKVYIPGVEITEDTFKIVRPIRRTKILRTGGTVQTVTEQSWVCSVDHLVCEGLIKYRRIPIDNEMHEVELFIDVMQCYKCWGLNHTQKTCKWNITCYHCGLEHNREEECSGKDASPKFANCLRFKQNDPHHKVSDIGVCPILRNAGEKLIQQTFIKRNE